MGLETVGSSSSASAATPTSSTARAGINRSRTGSGSPPGRLTETVLLGVVAYRVGKKLEWDAEKLKATNCSEADAYVRKQYRKGWELAS